MGFARRLRAWRDKIYEHPVLLGFLIVWFVVSLPFGNPLAWFLDKRYGDAVYAYLNSRIPTVSPPGMPEISFAAIAANWTRINLSAFLLLLSLLLVKTWRESRPQLRMPKPADVERMTRKLESSARIHDAVRRESIKANRPQRAAPASPESEKRGPEPISYLGLCWTLKRDFFESYDSIDEPEGWVENCVNGPYCPSCKESLVRKHDYDWGGGTYFVIAQECEKGHAVDPEPLRGDVDLGTAKVRVYRHASALLREQKPLPPWP